MQYCPLPACVIITAIIQVPTIIILHFTEIYFLFIEFVSGYICNHGSPSGERDTASTRGRYGERHQHDPCLKHTYIKTPLVGRRQPMTSLLAPPQYKGRRENTSFALLPKHGTQPRGRSVSFPTRGTMVTYVN